MVVTYRLSCSYCPVTIVLLSQLSCPYCHVLPVRYFSSVKAELSGRQARFSDLFQLSCPYFPAQVGKPWLSCHGCPVPVFLSQLFCLPVMFLPSCPLGHVQADLSRFICLANLTRLTCPPVLFRITCPSCPATIFLQLLSCLGCPALDVLSCHVLAVLKSLS
jgi:hypothetical protein